MSETAIQQTAPGNTVHQFQAQLAAAFAHKADHDEALANGAGRCLRPFLAASGWRGGGRQVAETLPHFDAVVDIDTLRIVLAHLNYPTWPRTLPLAALRPDMLPCLFETDEGRLFVVVSRDDSGLTVFDAAAGDYRQVGEDDRIGTAYVVSPIDHEQDREDLKRYGWGFVFFARMRRVVGQLLAISFLINLFALAIPIFVMNVYDKAIGTSSVDLVIYFVVGILIVLAADGALRTIRARTLAYMGARWETLVGNSAFQQLLYLPLSMTERSPISAQIARLRQFDGVRDMFTGQAGAALLDLPFLIVFMAAISLIGGIVAWVPATLIAIYVILGAIAYPMVKARVAAAGEARNEMIAFLTEMVSMHRTLRESSAQDVWARRYAKIVAKSALADFKSQQLNHRLQIASQSLTTVAGVATLGVGAVLAMEGEMTIGALIAVMALIWRVLGPLQTLFLSASTMSQGLRSLQQVNQLMRLQLEQQPEDTPSIDRPFSGGLALDRVSFRYKQAGDPALMGVALGIEPNSCLAIAGTNGSGKSTLLKLMCRLYTPQAGAVLMDGLDLRQFDAREIRRAVSYLPQHVELFHGTIEQNLRLADPTAEDEDIARVLAEMGLQSWVDQLPRGTKTVLNSSLRKSIPDGVRQRLGLARAFVRSSPIYLLDEPANNLDDEGDAILVRAIEKLRGKATVVMVTARPSHMRLADRVVYLDRGQILHDGPPEEVVPAILSAA